jgi:sodium-dependent dicarboxylate transporter 2/3/5
MKKTDKLLNLEKQKQKIGLVLAPSLAFLSYLLPLDIPTDAKLTLSIMVFCSIFWFLEVLPLGITAILGVSLAVILGITPVKEAFVSLGHPVILLFIGSFLIARAMTKYGLDKRIAINLLSKDIFLKSPFRILLGFTIISFFLSMWISNTATTAMLLPLALGIIHLFEKEGIKDAKKFGVYLLLALAYTASIGGTSTLVGTPTNLVGVGFLKEVGYEIDFLKWSFIAFPVAFGMFLFLLFYIKLHIRKFSFDYKKVKHIITLEKSKLSKLSKGEGNTLFVFLITVFLWILPGIFNILGNKELYKFFKAHLPEGIVAILGAILLFLLRAEKGKTTLDTKDLKNIDWDTVFLFGGGIALGKLIVKSGLASYIGNFVAGLVSPDMAFLFIFSIILSMVFLTEISSNTATTITFVPIIIGALQSMNIDVFYSVLSTYLPPFSYSLK